MSGSSVSPFRHFGAWKTRCGRGAIEIDGDTVVSRVGNKVIETEAYRETSAQSVVRAATLISSVLDIADTGIPAVDDGDADDES